MPAAATLTAFNEPNGIDETARRMWLRGKLAFAAGTYTAGGLVPIYSTILDTSGAAVLLPTSTVTPLEMILLSDIGSGYFYFFNPATGAVKIMQAAGSTPSGAVSAPTITTVTGTPATAPIGTAGGALVQTAGATGITGVQAPTFTGFASAATPLVELVNGNALPSGVTSDIIHFVATWQKQ